MNCPHNRVALRWQTFIDGSRHIEERCAVCRAFIRWAPQTPETVARTESVPEQASLFDVELSRSPTQDQH